MWNVFEKFCVTSNQPSLLSMVLFRRSGTTSLGEPCRAQAVVAYSKPFPDQRIPNYRPFTSTGISPPQTTPSSTDEDGVCDGSLQHGADCSWVNTRKCLPSAWWWRLSNCPVIRYLTLYCDFAEEQCQWVDLVAVEHLPCFYWTPPPLPRSRSDLHLPHALASLFLHPGWDGPFRLLFFLSF